MLLCQNGCGAQECHLTRIGGSKEGCPHGNLGLAKAHVAAHKPVHGHIAGHVPQDVLYGPVLVRCFLVAKGRAKFRVELVRGIVVKALGHLAKGVHLDKVCSNLFDCLSGLFPGCPPGH